MPPAFPRSVFIGSISATVTRMETIGLRELRQDASSLIRRVEGGEELLITVAGRPAAKIVPAAPNRWRQWTEVVDLFRGPDDPAWSSDREEVAHDLRDPWTSV